MEVMQLNRTKLFFKVCLFNDDFTAGVAAR